MLTLLPAVLLLAGPAGLEKLSVKLVKLTASEQKAAVGKVVNGQLGPLKGCYDLALKDTPDLKGELEIDFDLQAGQVGETTVAESSTVKDDTVAQCMMARLRSATWPKTKAGAKVTVRLKLSH